MNTFVVFLHDWKMYALQTFVEQIFDGNSVILPKKYRMDKWSVLSLRDVVSVKGVFKMIYS